MIVRSAFRRLLIFTVLIAFVISISTCKKKDDNNQNDEGPIPETTKIIDQAAWQENFVGIDTSSFTFTFKNTLLNKVTLNVGDVLVSGAGNGYLRKITKVEQDGNNVRVYSSFASLNEAIKDGTFALQTLLSQKKIQKITYFSKGIRIDTSHIKSNEEANIEATIDEYLDSDKKIHLTGSFSMAPTVICELDIKMFKVERFKIEYEIGEQINLECTMELLNLQFSKEVTLVKITFTPVSIFIGPVPVVIVPELEILVGADLNIQSTVTTSVDQQMSYGVGVIYENETWAPFQEKTNSFTFTPPTLSATASAKAYIKPQLNLKFYGTLAPYVYGEAYARLQADLVASPWWTLYGGANVGAGVKMDIFGKEIFDWPENPFYLFEYEQEIVNSTTFQENQPPTIPSDPQPVNNLTNVPTTVNLTWQCSDPDEDPLTFDVYFGTSNSPPLVQSGTTSFSYNPGTLLENTVYYWKVIAKDDHDHTATGPVWNFKTVLTGGNQPPLQPSDPNPPNGAIAVELPVTLSWACSDPENDPLLYDVFFGTTIDPPIAQTNQSTTSFQPTGLVPGTQYYWKIIAKDDQGNSTLGNLWSFSVVGTTIPTITTASVTNITQTTATSGGNVTSDGGATVTVRGVCWSTSQNPTVADYVTTDGNGTGSFTSNLTGLSPNTPYYVKAYAVNTTGIGYGEQIGFTTTGGSAGGPCPGMPTITDSRDGQAYPTVLIGSQCWLQKNMNYNTVNSWCYDSSTNCDTYGRLYDWQTALGACPSGWHLPGDAELTVLTDFLGGESVAGGKMKEAGTAHWWPPNTGATNSSGFTALPGGLLYYYGYFGSLAYSAYFWSSSEYSSTDAWGRVLGYNTEYMGRNGYPKTNGFSVRCVKD